MSARPKTGSQTLERGLRLLAVLADRPDGLSVSELAEEMGTHRAGIYRLLAPLLDHRLVVRNDDGRHLLGPGLVALASRVRPRLQEIATPELRSLADHLSATTALTVRDGEDAIVAAVLGSRNTDIHVAYRTGLRHRLDQAASGIAILAALPSRQDERAEIRRARERGWALSSGELLPGATGIGVAVGTAGQPPSASISAVWVGDRDPEPAAERLRETARRISAQLGAA